MIVVHEPLDDGIFRVFERDGHRQMVGANDAEIVAAGISRITFQELAILRLAEKGQELPSLEQDFGGSGAIGRRGNGINGNSGIGMLGEEFAADVAAQAAESGVEIALALAKRE